MMMMMPMEEVEVVEEEGDMGTEEIKRKRRSALPSSLIQVNNQCVSLKIFQKYVEKNI